MSEPISNIPTSEARVPRMGESTRMHLSLTQTGNKRGIHKLRKTKPNEIVFASQKRCNMHQTTPIDPDIGADINYKKIFRQVNSSNPRIKCKGMQTARSILSSGKQPPIEAFIKSGIVKVLVNCLKDDAHPKVQFDAVWALTNVSSGTSEQTNSIVTDGALPNLYRLLDRPLKAANFELIEQIIWCVGNCLGDGHELRDLLVEEGFAFQILNLITNSPIILPTSLLRNLSWCMSNLSRNKTDSIDLADASKWMAAHHILIDHEDVAVKSDAIWSLYYLLDGGEDEIEMISENGFFPKLIALMDSPEGSIRAAALKCVGTVLSGNDFYTQVMLDLGALVPLKRFMLASDDEVKKEAGWCVSNICAGSQHQIGMLQKAGFFPIIVNQMSQSHKVQKEAVWCVISLTSNANTDQFHQIVKDGALEPYCKLLNKNDPRLLEVMLTGIYNMLENHDTEDFMIAIMIEECGGMKRIDELQSHESFSVYKSAYEILDRFYSE